MNKDISKILGEKLTGSLSADDEIVLNRWKYKSEENSNGYELLNEFWHKAGVEKKISVSGLDYERLQYRVSQSKSIAPKNNLYWKVASVILLLLSFGLSLLWIDYQGSSQPFVLTTELGQHSNATLPDGTNVWLNAGTTLTVSDFNNKERIVCLNGGAFFEVAHNNEKPFIVKVQEMEIEVVGTSFNVSGYDNEPIVKTTLIEGVVNISSPEYSDKKYQIKPGQTAFFDKTVHAFTVKIEKADRIQQWRNGVLTFNGTAFDELIRIIERQYNVIVDYNPNDFKGYHYSGTIDKLRLEQVFDFINLSIPINYNIQNNVIILQLANK